jgi:hypothetical protein
MRFLVIKTNDSLDVVSPETYGMATWGANTQEGIDKRDDGWYSTYWSAGNEWIEDTIEEDKLDVVLETKDIDEVLAYVLKNNPKEFHKIITAIKDIVIDYLDFEDYFRSRDLEN